MTSETKAKTIVLRGEGVKGEGRALTAITPGMLLVRTGENVGVHAVSGGPAQPVFATEALDGGVIDDDYAINDWCYFHSLNSGARVNALVAASATAILAGDALVSAGDGTLKKLEANTGGVIIGYAVDALDNSSGTTPARLRVDVGVSGTAVAP